MAKKKAKHIYMTIAITTKANYTNSISNVLVYMTPNAQISFLRTSSTKWLTLILETYPSFPSHIFLDQITGQCSLKLNLLWMCTVRYPYFRLQMSRTGETLHWLDTGTVVAYWYALPLTTDPLESPRSS